jgi:HK97 family phage major capsid protein/HK97 family phage prohead protease
LLELQGERGRMARQATFDQQTINVEQRTVEIAFSSEVEVPQWFGIEVLDHSPGAVDLSRLNDSASLLVNHDWDDQVGVVVSASIDNDRRGRAIVRFGRSARAEEVFQDVIDGIRKHISVGYQIIDAKLTEERDSVDVWTITAWQPYEISFVSVPADISVGVGRSMGNSQEEQPASATDTSAQRTTEPVIEVTNTMKEKTLRDAKGNLVRAMVDDNGKIVEVLELIEAAQAQTDSGQRSGSEAAQRRVNAILEMGERFGAQAEAITFARDANKTAADFQAHLLEKFNQRASQPLNEQTRSADIGLTEREIGSFSLLNVIRAMADPTDQNAQKAASFEFEASQAARAKAGKDSDKFMVPADVLRSAIMTTMGGMRSVNAGSNGLTGTGSTGGNLIATNLLADSFIDILRHRTTIMKMARILGGLVGNIDIPKQTTQGQGYWLGEDDTAPESDIDFGQISLSPKTVAAFTDITRKLMKQSTPDAEALVRFDLACALALTIDKAGYYGTGAANQPLGIANTTGIHAVNFATAGAPLFPELVSMETAVALDDADVETMAYVANAGFRGYAKTALKFPGSASAATIWEPGKTVNGYSTEITNQISSGDVFLGNFADLVVGMWGGLELQVDPYSQSTKGRLRVIVFQDVDFALRRTQSFCLGRHTGA